MKETIFLNMNRNEEFASEIRELIKTTYGSESALRTGTLNLIFNSNLNDDFDSGFWILFFENETECESNFWNCIQKMKKNLRNEKLWELGTGTWKKIWFYMKFRCKDVPKLNFKLQKHFELETEVSERMWRKIWERICTWIVSVNWTWVKIMNLETEPEF